MKVLLIEDDPNTAQFLSTTLSAERYAVDLARDGQIGLELVSQWKYDIVVLDVVIPRLDGIEVCQRLRSQGYQMPILLVTAKNSPEDIVTGLDAGADDYLTKPVDLSQLLARIRALLRRGEIAPTASVFTWGKLTLDLVSLQVTYNEQPIKLKSKEYKLLELFLRHPKRVFSRNAIIDQIWTSDRYPTAGAVTNLIKDLRQQLKKAGMVEEVIETVFGLGYRLKAPPAEKILKLNPQGIAAIAKAQADFRASLADRIRVLQEIRLALLNNTLTQRQRERGKEEAHKLVGGLGTFGYPGGVLLARQIEELLSKTLPLKSAEIAVFCQKLNSLQKMLSQSQPEMSGTKAISLAPSFQFALNFQPQPLSAMPDKPLAAKAISFSDRLKLQDFLSQLLQPWGITLVPLSQAEELWKVIRLELPHLLLLDLELPTFNLIEFCRQLRSHNHDQDLAIFAITAQSDPTYLQQLLAAGVDDFICQPILGPELVSRVVNRLKRSQFPRQLSHQQSNSIKSQIDALTRLPNREAFEGRLPHIWQQLSQESAPLALILSNIDYFRLYNLCYGYAAGNNCLRLIAKTLQQCLAASSLVARYRGEEFAILLPRTSVETAVKVTQIIQQQIAQLNLVHEQSSVSDRLTLSLGVVGTVPTFSQSLSTLITTAEQALATAKWRGRNTYCLYPL
ncbi:MAG TPA: response regulator [Xenococcaceae cyanobacterium]